MGTSEIDVFTALGDVLRRLAAAGLGPSLGADFGPRTGIGRVARLSEAELRRRLSDIYASKYESYLGYAIAKLGSRVDAEDVVNESFARVLRANPDLDVPDALAGYVRTTVTNEANRRGSGITRDRNERAGGDPADLEATLQDSRKPFEDRVADEITIGLAIQLLSPREQQVIALRHIEDVSEKDTAARMNVQPGAVKRYRSDAVKKIQAALAAAV
jgi:RNA polymerase sigma factor (sigma-70 family)